MLTIIESTVCALVHARKTGQTANAAELLPRAEVEPGHERELHDDSVGPGVAAFVEDEHGAFGALR